MCNKHRVRGSEKLYHIAWSLKKITRNDEPLLHTTSWMTLTKIMLSEGSHSTGYVLNTYYRIQIL